MDLVVTCAKTFWKEWIAEGDAAGDPPTGEEWGWYMSGRRPPIEVGDRLYVVAWGRLRGWAPVTRLRWSSPFTDTHGVRWPARGHIAREGGAVACTIPEAIPGFRSWRHVWWPREAEIPFPDWKTAGVP